MDANAAAYAGVTAKITRSQHTEIIHEDITDSGSIAIKGGQSYGSTSKDGMDIKDKPCSIGDVFATLYKGLGLDPATQVRDNLGRPLSIADGKPLAGLV